MPDNKNSLSARKDPIGWLLEKVPEYRDQMDEQSLDLPYMMFGFFAQYLLESVNDPDVIRRVFELLNQLCDSGDPELQNLAQVGVFEIIATDRRWTDLALRHLNPDGLNLFRSIQSANDMR